MSVIQIRKAERSGARLVLGLSGVSGCGKTYTALQIAYGLANGDGNKVGFLDTENRRGSLYASPDTYANVAQHMGMQSQPEPFLIGDLYAPFSPQRYIDALHQFQQAGVDVLVVDSVTHEWEGTGGCEEIAATTTSRMSDWKAAKAEHKRFMNALLQTDMHIIVCIRAREKTDFTNPKQPRSLGIQPIQEKNFMFEMTASLMLWNEGTAQQVLKCPKELQGILGRGQDYITAADGLALRRWVEGAGGDRSLDKWRHRLQSITEHGEKYVNDAWQQTPDKVRQALSDEFYQTLINTARAHDQAAQGAEAAAQGSAQASELNDALGDDDAPEQPSSSGPVTPPAAPSNAEQAANEQPQRTAAVPEL